MSRALLHADLDAFFASVEQLDHPGLRGKPLVVGGSPESRGVVAAASYEARALGIRSAMPMHQAVRRCPSLVRVSPRFDRYRELSHAVIDIYRRWTLLVEPLSLDEAYLDLTASLSPLTHRALREAASRLKSEVRAGTGLTISVGGGSTKSVAKIASDLHKPDGLVVVAPGDESAFLWPLPVARLWGVGPKAAARLKGFGVQTIGDLAQLDRRWIEQRWGKWGAMLHNLANGIDTRAVQPEHDTKSVSRETTFATDTDDPVMLHATLSRLAAGVGQSLEKHGLRGRTVGIKLRDSTFQTLTRQSTIECGAGDADSILAAARPLLDRELRLGRRFRLIGVGVSTFIDAFQLPLIPDPPPLAVVGVTTRGGAWAGLGPTPDQR